MDDITPRKVIFFEKHKRLFVEIYKLLLKKKRGDCYEITFEELVYAFKEIEYLVFSLEQHELIKYLSND